MGSNQYKIWANQVLAGMTGVPDLLAQASGKLCNKTSSRRLSFP